MYQTERSNFMEMQFGSEFLISPSEVSLGKGVLKICRKFTGEQLCRSAISIKLQHSRRSVISLKLQSNFIEITLRHGCSPVNLLHIFRTSFPKNSSGGLLMHILMLVVRRCIQNPNRHTKPLIIFAKNLTWLWISLKLSLHFPKFRNFSCYFPVIELFPAQWAFSCSSLRWETIKQSVKYVHS